MKQFTQKQLFDFIDKAGKFTYAGEGKQVLQPERLGFTEFEYYEGNFSYRDSYVGDYKSRGMEVIRYKNIPVWASMYGGGIIVGKEHLDNKIIKFLKQALSKDEKRFCSLRGPSKLTNDDWKYTYKQEGDIYEFYGYEEVFYKGELVFFHRIIGGIIEYF